MLDALIIILLYGLLYSSNGNFARRHKLSNRYATHLNYLLLYHIFFTLAYTAYILNFGGDSTGYWRYNLEQIKIRGDVTWWAYFGTGTTFPLFLNYFPSRILGLGYFTGNALYGALSFIGIRYLFVMVYKHFPTNVKWAGIALFPWVFYLPNMHFWTGGVSKDTLTFFGIAIFLYGLQHYKTRTFHLLIGFLIAYYTRPHIGFMLLGGGLIGVLFGTEFKGPVKVLLVGLSVIVFFAISQSVLNFLKIDSFDLDTLETLSDKKAVLLSSGSVGSAVDLSNYPLPLKIFTFLYRPLFIDAHNIIALFSSVENLIYLLFSLQLFRHFSIKAFMAAPVFLKAGIVMFIPSTIAFANSLSNMGIAMRMKNMTMIYLMLFIFFCMAFAKQQQEIQRKKRREALKMRFPAKHI